MRSLRLRLTLGVSIVAVVPLAIVVLVLSQRVLDTVRAEAAERLEATLAIVGRQLRDDADGLAGKLAVLGRDPTLKRLALVPADHRDLAERLEQERVLLALDLLIVADRSGAVIGAAGEAARDAADTGAPLSLQPAAPRIAPLGDRIMLTASAPIPYQGEIAGFVRGGMRLDGALLARLERTSGVRLTLRAPDGAFVATSGDESPDDAAGPHLERAVPLAIGAGPPIVLTGRISTAAADRTIAALRLTALVLGLLGLGLAVALGTLWSAQVSRPVERLAAFSARIAAGQWDEPLDVERVRELDTLVTALERMRADLVTYRERLKTGERHAAWGLMARQMAHEIKNPLTPIAVSAADLRRSYARGTADFSAVLDQNVRTIEEEVRVLTRLLQAFAEFGALPAPRVERLRATLIADDLAARHTLEVAGGRLRIAPPDPTLAFDADREQWRQALVNLIRNALDAIGPDGHVSVAAHGGAEAVEWTVSDTGPGLSADARARLFTPFFTTKAHGTGLGLVIVERIVSEHGGTIAVDSEPGRGTTFRLRVPMTRKA